ncbi:MAG: UDP-N-acetylmuramate dehydrogenase [Clostridia bacterium]|nr:UDP-N-acetylmuramate dehydrogenase [Clostridia bacterium]
MYNKLLEVVSEDKIFINEPMKKHTSFKIGGNADYLILAKNATEIINVISLCKKEKIPFFIMGNGSNLLVSDRGISGVVIKTAGALNSITVNGDEIIVESGVMLKKIANTALEHSLTGFEELSGIPGTVGGAVYMNAGAYGREFKDIVVSVKYIDENGNICEKKNSELDFYHRHSVFTDTKCVILETVLKLEKGNKDEISDKMKEITKKRKDKQPLEYPSAGSTFKRPVGCFAAALIEEAGLKGRAVGDAEVSVKHSGFVINKGNAAAADVLELIDIIKDTVKKKFNVELELEVQIVGR